MQDSVDTYNIVLAMLECFENRMHVERDAHATLTRETFKNLVESLEGQTAQYKRAPNRNKIMR